ncbi:conserved hypothetical protein [Thiomonas arsenitoxydans]|uniref:Uncharacterized protein n=1 Tax=Thiomonas arsenitoxydans (strain DSM 22701 / CIP 110005 / 3As) TaxID=426114 RepID=A0ABM9T6N6_THIA3|nr:conserved hypothetical protein [Thiomonas arsenitoxydans]CQR36031.1 conserved hypothetical protein [Thiomonas arsenitoxydans]
MRTGTTGAIVKHHRRRSRAAVDPDISAVCLARARRQLGYRGLIGMQHGLLQQMVFEGLGQRFQAHPAQAHPLRQARAREVHAAAAVNLLLAVQRQVIVVLGQHHLRQQAGGGNAFVNELRWQGCSQHRLAAGAGILAADVPVHEETRGLAVELLADLLPDTAQGVALRAQAGVDLVAMLDARQLAGQGLAFGATFAWGGALRIGGAVLGLFLGLQQRLRLGVEELALRVQALAGLAEAPLLEARQLEAQGRNLGRLKFELGTLVRDLCTELRNDRARVLRRRIVAQGLEFVVVDGADHAEFSRAHARARIGSCPDRQTSGGLHHGNGAGGGVRGHALPRQPGGQPTPLLGTQVQRLTVLLRPGKPAFLQSARAQPDPRAIKDEHLQPGGAAVGKHVGMVALC